MGLFDKLFKAKDNSNPSSSGASFDEQYESLLQLSKTIMPYSYRTNYKEDECEKLINACEQFLKISEGINTSRAIARIRKEARRDDPGTRYPLHKGFQSVVFGDADDWKRVVRNVVEIETKVILWEAGNEKIKAIYSNLPNFDICLTDDIIKRQNVSEMPGIKYSPVTKSFNKDKLLSYVVIDTETTGLKASSERIIQLSAIKYVEWTPVEIWNTYVNPHKEISAEATKVNGITESMLVDKPSINQVAQSFVDFIGNNAVVGYNLPFDLKFLFAEGIDIVSQKRKFFDVYELAKKAYKKELDSFSLIDVAKYNSIYYDAHNSLNDSVVTGLVFENIINEMIE